MFKDIKHIYKAIGFVWNSSKKYTILQCLLIFFQALLPLINLFVLKQLIDTITHQTNLSSTNTNEILYYVILMGSILLLTNIVSITSQYISVAQSQRVSDYMSTLLQEKSVEIDLQFYEDAAYHDTLHRAQQEGLYRPIAILKSLISIFQNGLSITAIAVLFVLLHWGIAVVFILTALPAFFIKIYYSKVLFNWKRETTQLERESRYLNKLVTHQEHVKEMRVFDVSHIFIKKFKALRIRLFGEKMGIEGKRARAEAISRTVETVATISIYGFVAFRAASGNITIGDFVLYFQAFQKGQVALKATLVSLAGLYENRLFLQYIFEFLQIKPVVNNPVNPMPLPTINQSITFQNVHFTYPSSRNEIEVLKDINLEFKKGQVIALVGENGSGKTTLIKLLSRLYDVSKGSILFDGKDIKDLNISDVRQKISIIFQDFSKYDLSVTDNVTISNMHEPIDLEKVKEAVKNTKADQFINDLPDQYDNLLGLQFRKGTELSGGQWQKIALARAFYKKADIIVLDEPTSAIDPLAEHAIFEKFQEGAKNNILILITHRLYNLKMADQIIVMEKGEVIEVGKHDALVQQKGKYFKMFEKQMN